MKKFIILSVLVCLFASCIEENLVPPSVGNEEVLVDLAFGGSAFDMVRVGTKATLDVVPESRVTNMFVFIFVGEKRYYAHYFDKEDLRETMLSVTESPVNCWYVDQMTSATDAATNGTLRIKCPSLTGGQIYIMANIDADMVNVSPEKLNTVTTLSQLKALSAVLNQEITSRNGLFPMAGVSELVDISSAGIFKSGTSDGVKVMLERFDAKIKVNFRVATDNELSADEGGVVTTQRLKEFRPESWCVRNLPKGCYIIPQATDAEEGYFDTTPVIFETNETGSFVVDGVTVSSAINGFSFYMLENRETPKNAVAKFSEREQKNKDASGQFDSSSGVWTNAPENGTYLEIKGEVVMEVDVSNEAKTQQLAADVTYYIHLGDVNADVNDYSIKRNTIYTYTVTIKGVSSIEVEVKTSYTDAGDPALPSDVVESEPGAEGMVYIAKESIFTFDAHYGQRVFAFDAAYIDPSTVTWYVKTPFGKEGTPDKVGDTEVPSGMDYKWVHFRVNSLNDDADYSYTYNGSPGSATLAEPAYSHHNMPYPGDGSEQLMDIVEFTKFIKEQKRAYDAGNPNAFRTEFDQEWFDWYNSKHPGAEVSDPSSDPDAPWFRDRVYITVFVDEYYYETNPITGDADPLLWKRFVNQPNRLMHILCDNQKSQDKASSATGSVITLRQRSIQTPYNIEQDDLLSGWGCETEDENADSYLWFFDPAETMGSGTDMSTIPLMGNTAVHNGLFNTARLWGVTGTDNAWHDVSWTDYLDYDRENDYLGSNGYNIVFLRDSTAVLRYSAMMRNRDNNGNGVIDPEEIRWYTASLGQLQFLYFGELGLNEDAILYPDKYSNATGKYSAPHPYDGADKWRCHVISSTANSGSKLPRILWAEEGLSVSNYRDDIGWGLKAPYSVKCVRNLGFDSKTSVKDYYLTDSPDAEENRPQNMVDVTYSDGVYKFDMTNINDASKRFYTSVELEPYDDNSEMARIYQGFETGVLLDNNVVSDYADLKAKLEAGEAICPNGYRVPNVRELGVMYILCDDSSWWDGKFIMTSTYYSLGPLGKGIDLGGSKSSWTALNGSVFTLAQQDRYIRCVRDWNP
ncbi:MAG: hypothetical protein ACI3ZK_00515 [Candidatus Cryptobacteroides sp.]